MTRELELKQAIADKGLKLKYIAEKSCMPYESLLQYLNGNRPMPDQKFLLVCFVAEVDPKKFGFNVRNSEQKEAG